VRVELEAADLVGELLVGRSEVNRYPADVVLRGVRVGDLLADGHRNLEILAGLDLAGAVDDRDVLLRFPVRRLIPLAYACHGSLHSWFPFTP